MAVTRFFLSTPGDYTLDIDPVELEDDARFQCQVGAAEGIEPVRSRYAKLTVLVPPDPPRIMAADLNPDLQMHDSDRVIKTVEDRQVEITCESRGGKPAAEVHFRTVPSTLQEGESSKIMTFHA